MGQYKKYKRVFTIVLDSLGVGAMEDSAQYGDVGVDTLGHIAEYAESLEIPNLRKLGMANLHPMKQNAPMDRPMGKYMKMREKSCGKDTMTGHGGGDCHRPSDRLYIGRLGASDLRK